MSSRGEIARIDCDWLAINSLFSLPLVLQIDFDCVS